MYHIDGWMKKEGKGHTNVCALVYLLEALRYM